jgi:hypothetical protein
LGKDVAGYDPLTSGQVVSTLAVAVALLVLGMSLYSRLLSRRD